MLADLVETAAYFLCCLMAAAAFLAVIFAYFRWAGGQSPGEF